MLATTTTSSNFVNTTADWVSHAIMSGFQPVNAPSTASEPQPGAATDSLTPTTPRPLPPADTDASSTTAQPADDLSAKTPTRDSFHGISGQRPLPAAPYTPPHEEEHASTTSARADATPSQKTSADAEDVDMQDDDGDEDGSDGESVNSDSGQPRKKKKKGQRFFCTDFPPCQLSFTRSEHLARHIRKHTGERPFQCHCSRRFSRLDNLRQHAQTVHVNEDIPGDSLAATGTRFQRQIRTDRVRPPPSRSRASTLSASAAGHGRGHSRNLSTSSIASTVSTMSTATQLSQADDFRRRPATLAMSSGVDLPSRNRLSLESFNPPPHLVGSPGPTFYAQPPEGRSPGGYSTPPPLAFSSTTSSPRFSALQSPPTSSSRPYSYGGPPTSHSRRLSQPASAAHNPFQPPHGSSAYQSPPYVPPLPSTSGQAFQSTNSSVYASPTSTTFPNNVSDRQETSAEAEWRRRTWHPSTHTQMRPATSGLSRFENADSPTPERTPAQGPTRLPGIESFDHAPPLPALPRLGSPMQIDPPPQQQQQQQVDMGIQQGIRRLEIANPDSRNESRPAHQPSVAEQYQALVMHPGQPTGPQLPSLRQQESAGAPPPIPQRSALRASAFQPLQHNAGQTAHQPVTQYATQAPPTVVRFSDTPPTPRQNKRHGWYNGPPSAGLPPQEQSNAPHQHPRPQYAIDTSQQPTPTQPTHSRGSSTNTIRTSPEESPSSEGVPTPASSNLSGYSTTNRHSNGFFRPLSSEFPKPMGLGVGGPDRLEHRSDLASWSLQGAQNESRKREREEADRGDYTQRTHQQQQPTGPYQHQPPHQQQYQQQQPHSFQYGQPAPPPQQQLPQIPQQQQQHQPRDSGVAMGQSPTPHIDSGMRRLEALVAVATGESRA